MKCNGCGKEINGISYLGLKGSNLKFHNEKCLEVYKKILQAREKMIAAERENGK